MCGCPVYSVAPLARQHDPVLALVLVGIAVSALCGSAISLMKILADPYTQLPAMTFWLLGGLSAISPDDIKTTAPLIFRDGAASVAALAYESAQPE